MSDVPEDQAHIATSCPGYSDLWEKYDLSTEDGLLKFYREVLSRREEKDIVVALATEFA